MTLLLSTTFSTALSTALSTPAQSDSSAGGFILICVVLGFGALIFDMIFRASGG